MLLLSAVELAMLARAVLSLFMPDGEGPLLDFIFLLTEPLVLPFRKLFERFGWFEGAPFDMAYLFAVITLGAVTTFLSIF